MSGVKKGSEIIRNLDRTFNDGNNEVCYFKSEVDIVLKDTVVVLEDWLRNYCKNCTDYHEVNGEQSCPDCSISSFIKVLLGEK